jgi:hypothetical protein
MTMIHLACPDPRGPSRLVDALLIAAGAIPVPADPDERQAFLDLADQIGDGLDRLPARPATEEATCPTTARP